MMPSLTPIASQIQIAASKNAGLIIGLITYSNSLLIKGDPRYNGKAAAIFENWQALLTLEKNPRFVNVSLADRFGIIQVEMHNLASLIKKLQSLRDTNASPHPDAAEQQEILSLELLKKLVEKYSKTLTEESNIETDVALCTTVANALFHLRAGDKAMAEKASGAGRDLLRALVLKYSEKLSRGPVDLKHDETRCITVAEAIFVLAKELHATNEAMAQDIFRIGHDLLQDFYHKYQSLYSTSELYQAAIIRIQSYPETLSDYLKMQCVADAKETPEEQDDSDDDDVAHIISGVNALLDGPPDDEVVLFDASKFTENDGVQQPLTQQQPSRGPMITTSSDRMALFLDPDFNPDPQAFLRQCLFFGLRFPAVNMRVPLYVATPAGLPTQYPRRATIAPSPWPTTPPQRKIHYGRDTLFNIRNNMGTTTLPDDVKTTIEELNIGRTQQVAVYDTRKLHAPEIDLERPEFSREDLLKMMMLAFYRQCLRYSVDCVIALRVTGDGIYLTVSGVSQRLTPSADSHVDMLRLLSANGTIVVNAPEEDEDRIIVLDDDDDHSTETLPDDDQQHAAAEEEEEEEEEEEAFGEYVIVGDEHDAGTGNSHSYSPFSSQ